MVSSLMTTSFNPELQYLYVSPHRYGELINGPIKEVARDLLECPTEYNFCRIKNSCQNIDKKPYDMEFIFYDDDG
jgi:hypothetical protein